MSGHWAALDEGRLGLNLNINLAGFGQNSPDPRLPSRPLIYSGYILHVGLIFSQASQAAMFSPGADSTKKSTIVQCNCEVLL